MSIRPRQRIPAADAAGFSASQQLKKRSRAEVHAERIIATLEFIGIDFSGHRISATLEVTKHLDELLKD